MPKPARTRIHPKSEESPNLQAWCASLSMEQRVKLAREINFSQFYVDQVASGKSASIRFAAACHLSRLNGKLPVVDRYTYADLEHDAIGFYIQRAKKDARERRARRNGTASAATNGNGKAPPKKRAARKSKPIRKPRASKAAPAATAN